MWLQDVQDLQMNRLQINFYSIRGTSCHLQGYFSGLENGGMVALILFNTFTTLSKAFFGLTLMWTSEPWRNSFYCRVVLCIFLSSKKTPYRLSRATGLCSLHSCMKKQTCMLIHYSTPFMFIISLYIIRWQNKWVIKIYTYSSPLHAKYLLFRTK